LPSLFNPKHKQHRRLLCKSRAVWTGFGIEGRRFAIFLSPLATQLKKSKLAFHVVFQKGSFRLSSPSPAAYRARVLSGAFEVWM
jgi:hypothetical protein